ncbi:response regulator [Methylobacterium sp. 391_Methyba4]|uniref:response regulator n=1 Tax=Methylobacterium sp. 391_Methyba4 TaxID=3038924 RepID=UPI00241BEECC|nr:response regulator [Methylobacterium sp. 391_Methyba4]WFS09694.1 response regulator [Methylobacterium sp. 391_Methyba4]
MSADEVENAAGPRILIVDDQATTREIVTALCTKLGFTSIDVADNGAAALSMMRKRVYGIVLSDWNMEPMTGFELLRAVRADPQLARTKFLIMTARADADAVLAAKRFGVDNYLIKPFTPKILQEKILAVLD